MLLLVAALASSCATKSPRAGELKSSQITKLPSIRRSVKLVHEYDVQQIEAARAREEARLKIEREVRDREARRIALEREEQRQRRALARELYCTGRFFGEQVCQKKVSETLGDVVASGSCSAAVQMLETGVVDGGEVVKSILVDAALESDIPMFQVGAAIIKMYEFEQCLKG